jgi:hypothetical protein
MDKRTVLLTAAAAVLVLVLVYVAHRKKSKEGLSCSGANAGSLACQEEGRRQYALTYKPPRTLPSKSDQYWNQLIQQKQLQPTKEGVIVSCNGMSKQACQAEALRQYQLSNRSKLPNRPYLPDRPVVESSWNSPPTFPSF